MVELNTLKRIKKVLELKAIIIISISTTASFVGTVLFRYYLFGYASEIR